MSPGKRFAAEQSGASGDREQSLAEVLLERLGLTDDEEYDGERDAPPSRLPFES